MTQAGPTLHHGDAFIRTFRNHKTTVRPDDEAVHTRLRLRSRFTFKEVVLAVPAVAMRGGSARIATAIHRQ